MDTPFTLRAQQLRDLYNSVTLDGLNRDERLDVLLTLKCTVKVRIALSLSHVHTHTHTHTHKAFFITHFYCPQEHDCSLTREIVELVDREADLLVRGMKEETLQGNKHPYSAS